MNGETTKIVKAQWIICTFLIQMSKRCGNNKQLFHTYHTDRLMVALAQAQLQAVGFIVLPGGWWSSRFGC
jgi:hypothetical protein